MISLRQKVFDFMEDNPEASNDDIYEEFEASKKKDKDNVRRYKNQFLKELEKEKEKSSGISGISHPIPEVSQDIPPTYQEIDEDEPEMDFSIIDEIDDIPEESRGISHDIPTNDVPEYVKIAWNDLKGSIASIFKESKWPSKYASFQIFKNWMEDLLKNEL